LDVDLAVDPAKEKEMLHNFETIFRSRGRQTPRIYRCEDAETAHSTARECSGGCQLSVLPGIPK
jgi:hypothetical protein